MTQYATFRVGERMLGLDILKVREIIRVLDITPVPRAEPCIRGLLNLRGQIVTILDLAVRLGVAPCGTSEGGHIVILKQAGEVPSVSSREGLPTDLTGFLVDAIGDVVEADGSLAENAPANLGEGEERFVSGVVRTDAGLLVLLALPELLSTT